LIDRSNVVHVHGLTVRWVLQAAAQQRNVAAASPAGVWQAQNMSPQVSSCPMILKYELGIIVCSKQATISSLRITGVSPASLV